tara:strand:+ start:153 stop:485 length:333 start_codon:yes stop_codon:yes gene_type:complete
MNTQERIYSKLNSINKVELEAHRVELSLVDDVKKQYNLIIKLKEKAEDDLAKAKKSAVIADSEIKEFKKDANKAEKIAKELGISLKDMNLQKLFQDIKEAEKLFDDIISA